MAARPSGKIAAAEREGSYSLLRLNGECSPSLVGTTPFPHPNWLRNLLGRSTDFTSHFRLRPSWAGCFLSARKRSEALTSARSFAPGMELSCTTLANLDS